MRSIAAPTLLAACVLAASSAGGAPTLTEGPTAVRDGEGAKVRFAVSAATDVEVAVLDAGGRIVRHLAAGMLGPNAPAPLKAGSLTQEIAWDGTDDLSRAVPAGQRKGLKVRVRIGARAALARIAGRDGATVGGAIVGLAVGAGGEVYVLDTEGAFGRSTLRVFGPDGRYRRTIMPYSAATPAERSGPVGHLDVAGERLPVVFSGHGGNLYPLTSGMKHQTMVWHPRGHLLAVSAVGTIAEHGPPRHLLAFHPEGGAVPGVGFVGPQVRQAKGFMGGSGEGFARFFDHLALSPDGQWIYFVPCAMHDRKPRHAVFRLKWTDEALGKPFLGADRQSGADDQHFDDPQGVATDAHGNLYVCDRGNDRVTVFSPGGKLLGKLAVDEPEQIAVHPAGGEIYVLSRGRSEKRRDRWSDKTTLRKLSAWSGGEVKELARLEGRNLALIALDRQVRPAGNAKRATSPPGSPRLWAVMLDPRAGEQIVPIADRGKAFAVGGAINTRKGLAFPMFLAADAARGRVLIRERAGGTRGLRVLELKTGEISSLPVGGADVTVDVRGNIYTMDGYNTNSLSRYDPAGKPLPFEAVGSHKLSVRKYRGYGPNIGLRGHCVDLAGNVYLIRSNNHGYGGVGDNDGTCGRVDVYDPDGKLKTDALINGLGHGDCGLGVDAAGNLYVGMNVKAAEAPLPEYLAGKAPATGWVWWRKQRPEPWRWPYYNPYLYHLGAVVKFGPEGGKVYGFGGRPAVKKGQPEPKLSPLISAGNAPPGAAALRSGYLAREIKVVGMKWHRLGCGIVPTSDVGWGDPSCVCWTSHLAVDPYGRVFAPNPFRFSVEMLDAAGNAIARIGTYGNADDGADDIRFAWPTFLSAADGRLYVSDFLNQRVSVIAFDAAAGGECSIE